MTSNDLFLSGYNSIPGDVWINKLQYAFDEADTQRTGSLTMEQWLDSRLRFVVGSTYLDDAKMAEHFNRIDSNCQMEISWADIEDYLLYRCDSVYSPSGMDKKLKVEFDCPNENSIKKRQRAARNLQILYLVTQSRIITLSETTLTVWHPDDCSCALTVTDKDLFVDCCLVSSMAKIAVAKANRQIVFFDVRNFQRMGMVISATLVDNAISKMDEDESRGSIVHGKSQRGPMFNRPSAIIGHPEQNILFVGDEEGRIEVFEMHQLHDWTWKRIRVEHMHNGAITKMIYVPESMFYMSSSMDGSIVIWRFDPDSRACHTVFKFKNRLGAAITSFVYDRKTKNVVYTTNAHCFGVWRTHTQRSDIVETRQHSVEAMEIVPLGKGSPFCVTVSKGNFAAIYRMPNLEPVSNYYMGLQHELCPPTAALFVEGSLYLAGAFLSKWKCGDGANDGLTAHPAPIVKAMQSQVFDRVLSIDKQGDFIAWNTMNGAKVYSKSLAQGEAFVQCAVLDPSDKRVGVGYSAGDAHIIASNSGVILTSIESAYVEDGCNTITFATILKSKRILLASGRKVVMFEDIPGNRLSFIRNFIGHTEEITQILVLKERFVLTIGSGKELFLWNIQQQYPIMKFQLSSEPATAVELADDPDAFVVGDVQGQMHLMTISSPTPVSSFNGVGLTMSSSVTTVVIDVDSGIFVVGNMHGYVMIYSYHEKQFVDVQRFRAHSLAVTSLAISRKHRVLVTSGLDEEIKVWGIEPFTYIGSLGKACQWNLEDPATFPGSGPLPDDPMHFVVATVQQDDANNDVSHDTEDVDTEFGGDHGAEEDACPFAPIAVASALDDMEHLCLSGRTCLKKLTARPDDAPKSARVVRPAELPALDVYFQPIVNGTGVADKFMKCAPKIWRPK